MITYLQAYTLLIKDGFAVKNRPFRGKMSYSIVPYNGAETHFKISEKLFNKLVNDLDMKCTNEKQNKCGNLYVYYEANDKYRYDKRKNSLNQRTEVNNEKTQPNCKD